MIQLIIGIITIGLITTDIFVIKDMILYKHLRKSGWHVLLPLNVMIVILIGWYLVLG